MATDMGGFAQAGGPYLVDRFGRPLAGQPTIVMPNGYRRVDAITALGGENTVILQGDPVANSIALTVNGTPVSWTINGRQITLGAALTTGQHLLVDYMATKPGVGATTAGAIDLTAISIYAALREWFPMTDTGSTVTGAFAGTVLSASSIPGSNFLQASLRGDGAGKSINFDGGSYYASNLSTGIDFTSGAGSSMFGWYKPTSLSGVVDGNLFGGAYNGPYALVYNMYSNASLVLAYFISGMTWYTNPSTSLTNNVVAHVGYTLDFTSKSVHWYINGSSIATATISALTNTTGKNSIEIGSWSANPAGRSCHGLLQDIVMCDKELSSTEVAYLYNSGNGISYATLKANSGH